MIYLRTIFSAAHEIKFLKLNLREAINHIDAFIVCEFNRTHTGEARELIFEKYLDQFTPEEKKKIVYIGADVSNEVAFSRDNLEISLRNNHIMLGYFARRIGLKRDDIVFSVDADEIIFEQFYEPLIKKLNVAKWLWQQKIIALPMRLFFYKINYLWENKPFNSAIVCKAGYYNNKKLPHWRNKGKLYPQVVGCHFSWCITVDEMVDKLNRYAHQKQYGSFAKREILEDAVKNKKYPFDSSIDFKIKVLDFYKDREYFPKSIYNMVDDFKDFIVN